MDKLALKNEITKDPNVLGYGSLLEKGNDVGIAALLNAPDPATLVSVEALRRDVKMLLISLGKLPAILAATDAVSLTAKYLLSDPDFATFDTTDARTQALMAGLKAEGLLTDADIKALTSLSQRPGSRAEVLWGVGSRIPHQVVAAAFGRGE